MYILLLILFHSLYFKFIYVKKLAWFVDLVFVSDEDGKPKAHVHFVHFGAALYLLFLRCFATSSSRVQRKKKKKKKKKSDDYDNDEER